MPPLADGQIRGDLIVDGLTKLYVNDTVVAEGPMRTQAGRFTLSGDGLCIGCDSGDNVSQEYKMPGSWESVGRWKTS